jgi:probable HAF family extracellular repeat protein
LVRELSSELPDDIYVLNSWASDSGATAINAGGSAVGFAQMPDGSYHLARWSDSGNADLGRLGIIGSMGRDINDSGTIVGHAMEAPFAAMRAFVYEGTNIRYLLGLGGGSDAALALNNAGTIVGQSKAADGRVKAIQWTDNVLYELDVPVQSVSSGAYDINDRGEIVGWSDGAVLWEGGMMYDLNEVIDDDSGWYLQAATAINATGSIAGNAYYNGGEMRAFLLTPISETTVPEPVSGAALVCGAWVMARRRR